MSCEEYSEWLSDAVDGTLSADRQAQVDAHCRDCERCRDLLNDLKDIRAAASELDRLTPSPDLWNAIAAKVDPRRAYSRSWVPLAAAAVLVMMLGTAAWFGLASRLPSSGGGSAANLARNAASELQLAEQHYQNAITALEQLTVNRDNALDPAVAAEIAQSLQSIDRAINDSRAALKAQPDSFVAQTSLLEALRMKVALLQETVTLMNARS
jgi:predicted anti-sigma-YlaC factor YlaD